LQSTLSVSAATEWFASQNGKCCEHNFFTSNCAHYSVQGLNAGGACIDFSGPKPSSFPVVPTMTWSGSQRRFQLNKSMRKKILTFAAVLNCVFIHSCNMINFSAPLPGKIVFARSMGNEFFIYEDSDTSKSSFKLPIDEKVEYGGVDWFNTRNAFIGTEQIRGVSKMGFKCNIVEFDPSGRLTNRIYEAEKGELAWPSYSSRDDRYLLFTSHQQADPELYPFEALTPMLSLGIIDLSQKKVITKIDSIGRDPNLKIEESPWLYQGYRIVFSIDGREKLQFKEKTINTGEATEGVYLYDVISGECRLLVEGGVAAIASPTNNKIAYEKDNSIRVLDLNTNEEKTIYRYSSKVQIFRKHWTPDGNDIYFAYKYHWRIGDLFNTGEKLIEIATGKDKSFKKIGHGFQAYTWK
jgi:hypothetical protein